MISSTCLLEVGAGSVGNKGAAELLGGWAHDAVSKRESDLGVVELSGRHTLAVLGSNCGSANDLDGSIASTVTTSHVVVHGVNGSVEAGITVLTVHIMSSTARVVLDPDTVVLDSASVLLSDLVDIKNLTSSLLHLTHLMHEIPKAGLGHHFIGSEEFHSVNIGSLFVLGGSLAADHLIKTHLSWHVAAVELI